ncbi:unnamed protein product [Rangifer tarandus platyrhynchus]|uniref:Uncharacterized protein n=1 Tax=Rangifer tarandus platyrhynchus TaxID=3082113 RepID=A0AC59ZQ02_RANTA
MRLSAFLPVPSLCPELPGFPALALRPGSAQQHPAQAPGCTIGRTGHQLTEGSSPALKLPASCGPGGTSPVETPPRKLGAAARGALSTPTVPGWALTFQSFH